MKYVLSILILFASLATPSKGGEAPLKVATDNELSPVVLKLLGLEGKRVARYQPKEYTSFQTHGGYVPEHDIKSDIAIVYTAEKAQLQSWKDAGYRIHCMWGPRASKDFCEQTTNGRSNWEEIQTLRDGSKLGHSAAVWYGAPGPAFTANAREYFLKAIENGAEAVVPEESEYFSQAGYCGFFKDEWQKFYGRPWEDQETSVQARYDSSRLKAELERRLIEEVFRACKEKKPSVQCIVAEHSPVNYGAWRIICPHYSMTRLPMLDGIIGQVWTGTARTPVCYQGKNEERTFENAYLEYSSLYNLVRGTGKKLWFLMDPLEDNGERSMEDYHMNYEQTLLASLFFPEVNSYEVLPWPSRIYGRISGTYATEISTVITALNDMHNQKTLRWDAGSQGIGTFIADSIMWQRGEPCSSNFDSFYGITLPLLMNGVPVQVAQLERVVEKDYLKPYKVLFLSYDAMKPTDPAIHDGLAAWVRDGGTLVFLGGNDPYNEVNEWWKAKGYAAPQEDLFEKLGISVKRVADENTNLSTRYTTVLEEKRQIRNLENRKIYEIDLEPFLKPDEARIIQVRFSDSRSSDGWGAWLRSAELVVDGKSIVKFNAGSPEETQYLFNGRTSSINNGGRFADVYNYWIYRFKVPEGKKAVLKLDMGNQFRVQISGDLPENRWKLTAAAENQLTRKFKRLEFFSQWQPLEYVTDAKPLYRSEGRAGLTAFTTKAGKGHFVFLGIPSAYYASSPDASKMLRAVADYALELQGGRLLEKQHLALKRGRYFIARCFDKGLPVSGRWINLLDPRLPVLENLKVPAHNWALLYDVGKPMATPRLLFASSRVEARNETASLTAFLISGPEKTDASARIETAGKKIKSAKAYDIEGRPIPAKFAPEADTLLATFPNKPKGVVVRIEWK